MRRVQDRIPMAEAERRALAFLRQGHSRALFPASSVAEHIWPGTVWKAQGAGGAASRVLRSLEKKGLAEWTSARSLVTGRATSWGWRAAPAKQPTPAGQ